MATSERTYLHHSMPMQGPTIHRPVTPPGGFIYFDTTIRMLLSYSSILEEWTPLGVSSGSTAQRPAAGDVPGGAFYFNTDIAALEYSTGSAWIELEVDDEQSSSSSSSDSSSSDSSASSSSASSASSDSSDSSSGA